MSDLDLNPKHIILLFVIFFLLGLGLMTYLRVPVANFIPIGVDIYPRWVGSRALWQGQNPYSETVRVESQMLASGGTRLQGNPYAFYYPAYISIILLPFLYLPIEWAGIVWSSLMWATLASLILVWSFRLDPRPSPLVWGLLLLSLFLFRPAVLAVINGQFGLFIIACLVLSRWLLTLNLQVVAGAVLFCSTIKPSLSVLAALVLLLWAIHWKLWKVTIGFAITAFLMIAITINRVGWWFPDFIYQLVNYTSDSTDTGLVWSTKEIFTLPGFVWLAGSLFLLAFGMRRLWTQHQFPWLAIFAALNLNLLISPHILDYDLVILLLPLFWLATEWYRKQQWSIAVWLCLVWFPWLYWAAGILSGAGLAQYLGSIWLVYPSLLIIAILAWLALDNARPRILRPAHGDAGLKWQVDSRSD